MLYAPRFYFDVPRRSLHDLAEWENGLAFKDIHFSPTGLPVIKIAEVKSGIGGDTKRTQGSYDESVRVRDGDLLFCWSGQPESSIGAYRWFGGDGWLNQHIFKVKPKPEIAFDYLFSLLRSLYPNFVEIARNKQTTGLGHVTKADLRELTVEVPPIAEQRRITAVLMPIDDKIELNRRMAATLEGMARAIFKSWFVDFDPVLAKAEGRPTGLPDDLAALFPDRFGKDGLPIGWEPVTLADLADLNPESWSRSNYPKIIQYVDLSNTKWGTIEAYEHYSRDAAPSRAQRILRPGDSIVGTVRPGNGSYALIDENGKTGSTGFAVLRPKRPSFRELVYLAVTSRENIERLAQLADGGAYPAVRPDVVAATEVPGFSRPLVEAFAKVVAPLIDRMESAKRESRTLATLRDTLLPKLISGELRIADAKQGIAAVA